MRPETTRNQSEAPVCWTMMCERQLASLLGKSGIACASPQHSEAHCTLCADGESWRSHHRYALAGTLLQGAAIGHLCINANRGLFPALVPMGSHVADRDDRALGRHPPRALSSGRARRTLFAPDTGLYSGSSPYIQAAGASCRQDAIAERTVAVMGWCPKMSTCWLMYTASSCYASPLTLIMNIAGNGARG